MFKGIYTIHEICAMFDSSVRFVKQEIDRKRLGFIVLQNASNGQNRIRVTGWQLIDYLELLENETAERHFQLSGSLKLVAK